MTGILMLESLTRGNTLKQGDKTPLTYRLLDADGDNLNIAGKTATVRLMYPNYLTIGYEKTGLLVSQDDTVTFTIDNVIPSRKYNVEIIVDNKYVFPSRSAESKFTIDRSSLGTEANVIEIVGVDQVINKVIDGLDSGALNVQPADGSITSVKLAQNAVERDNIKDSAIGNSKIALRAVTGDKVGFEQITSENIALQGIERKNIKDNAIGNAKIVDNAVTGNKILDGTIGSDKLADNVITNSKISDGSLSTPKYVRKSITPDKTDFILTGKNLFDRGKVTHNEYWGLSGTAPNQYIEIKTTTSVSSVPIFSVEPGATIHKNKAGGYFELDENRDIVLFRNMSTPAGTYTLSSDTVYLAVNVNNVDINTYQLEYGESETSYEASYAELDETISVSAKSIDTSQEKFNLSDLELETSPIIFDKTKLEVGYINRNNGAVVEDNGNFSSDYIRITSPTIIFSENVYGSINIAYYDDDFTYSGLSDQILDVGTDIVVTLQRDHGYIRFSTHMHTMPNLIVEWGDTITTSSDYYYSYPKGLLLKKFNLSDLELETSPIIFDKTNLEVGYINRHAGDVRPEGANNRVSDYIKITSPTIIFSENVWGAINIAYYNDDFTYSGLGDQIPDIGTNIVVALKQDHGYFRFSASDRTMPNLIVEWGNEITTSSDAYYSYPRGLKLPNSQGGSPSQSTDSIGLILGTTSATVSLGHVDYVLEHETKPFTDGSTYQHQDTWRIVNCTVNETSIVTRGAWECAIAIEGLPDFHGTYHGYELMDSINFYVDNKKVASGTHVGGSVRIVYKSKLIEQGTEDTVITEVDRIYEFEDGKMTLSQRYNWLKSFTIKNAYLTMLPITRDGITHTAYTDHDYVEYDVSVVTVPSQDINGAKLSVRDAWIYGDDVGVKVSVDYDDPSVTNTFMLSHAAQYNKFYYSYCVGRGVSAGDIWGIKAVFDIQ